MLPDVFPDLLPDRPGARLRTVWLRLRVARSRSPDWREPAPGDHSHGRVELRRVPHRHRFAMRRVGTPGSCSACRRTSSIAGLRALHLCRRPRSALQQRHLRRGDPEGQSGVFRVGPPLLRQRRRAAGEARARPADAELLWQDSRPPWGPGRVDTFNPYKTMFQIPVATDGSVGTADLPSFYDQRTRHGMSLHWDGNNDDTTERNKSAAIGAGCHRGLDRSAGDQTDRGLGLGSEAAGHGRVTHRRYSGESRLCRLQGALRRMSRAQEARASVRSSISRRSGPIPSGCGRSAPSWRRR